MFHVLYLHFHILTCTNTKLTRLVAVGMVRLAPSSRGARRERAGRAAGTSQDEPDARDPGGFARIRSGPRPPEKGREAGPGGPRRERRKAGQGGGSAGDGTPQGDPEPAKGGGEPQGDPPS